MGQTTTRNSHVLDGGSAAALRPAADSAAWSCADSRRSSFTTVASASGLTPFSVRPTRVDSSSLSRPVCSKREMSKRTAGGKLGEWVQGLARGGGGLHAPSIVSSRVRGASGGMARRARASERPLVISAARRLRGPALAARQVRAPCSVFRKPAITLQQCPAICSVIQRGLGRMSSERRMRRSSSSSRANWNTPERLAKAANAPNPLVPGATPSPPGHGRSAKRAHDVAQGASGTVHASDATDAHDTLGPNGHRSPRAHQERPHGQEKFALLEMKDLPENEKQEALEACKLARLELLRFVAAPPPPQNLRSCFTLLIVVLLRPFLTPFVGGCMEGWLPVSEFMQVLRPTRRAGPITLALRALVPNPRPRPEKPKPPPPPPAPAVALSEAPSAGAALAGRHRESVGHARDLPLRRGPERQPDGPRVSRVPGGREGAAPEHGDHLRQPGRGGLAADRRDAPGQGGVRARG